MFDNFKINYDILINPNWNEIAEQNYSNFLTYEMEMDSESNDLDFNQYPYYFDDFEDYDFEKEKINSFPNIQTFEKFDNNDLPF